MKVFKGVETKIGKIDSKTILILEFQFYRAESKQTIISY